MSEPQPAPEPAADLPAALRALFIGIASGERGDPDPSQDVEPADGRPR